MIRITIERRARGGFRGGRQPEAIVRTYDDVGEALNWLIHDSYFEGSDTVRATWERIDGEAAS